MRKLVLQISRALALPVLFLLAGSPAMATFPGSGSASWGCSSTRSDTTFLPDGASQNNSFVDLTLTSSLTPVPPLYQTKIITINRVVGPGTASEFDSNGFLVNWQTYKQNGILSPHAYLQYGGIFEIEVFEGTMAGVYLNGHLVKNVPLVTLATGGCLEIDTQYIKFAQRNPNPGQAPIPGVNTIGLTLDVTQAGILAQSMIGAFGALTFQAMAPIILVHGWRTGPWWWGDPGPANSNYGSTVYPMYCGPDALYPGRSTFQGGFGFIDPLRSGHYPFDCSISITNIDTDQAGATELRQKLLDCSGGVPDANFICPGGGRATGKLAEFGAKLAHLVAESKGGLWSRQMLYTLPVNSNGSQLFGVYSLTTLETPHLASSLADLLAAGRTVPLFALCAARRLVD